MENVFSVPLDKDTGLTLSLVLLKDVKNCRTVKEKVMSGELECCVMKANLIADPFQVIVAANKAALSHKFGIGVTKTVYTEILFNLSISKNISQSLIKFGVGDCDQDVLIAVLNKEGESTINTVLREVEGRVVPLETLSEVSDKKLICKTYKIGQAESTCSSLSDSIVSRIVTCDFVSH